MQVPLEITFRGFPRTDDIDALLRGHVDRLHRFCDDLIHCRVVVEQPQQHQHSGNAYRVRLEVTLPPKKHLVVTKEPGDNDMHAKLRTVLRGAFEAMERQLKDVVEQRRGDVKTHDEPHALVVRLFPEKDYGFLKTLDATEIYSIATRFSTAISTGCRSAPRCASSRRRATWGRRRAPSRS